MTKRTRKEVYPPGVLLKDELEARAKVCGTCGHAEPYQQKQFAKDTGLPERTVSEIINGKRRITLYTAKKIAAALGTSHEMWLNMQHEYNMQNDL